MTRKLQVIGALLFAASTFFAVVSCSKNESKNGSQTAASSTDAQSEQAALKTRAQARWSALIKSDYATAYTYETPAYRSINDLVHFQLQFAGQVQRKAVSVEKVILDPAEPDIATVVMKLDFKTMVSNQPLESTSYPRETWVKRDSEWWHLSKQ